MQSYLSCSVLTFFKVQKRVMLIFVSHMFNKMLGTCVQLTYIDVKINLICGMHKLLLFIHAHIYTHVHIQMNLYINIGSHEYKHTCLYMHTKPHRRAHTLTIVCTHAKAQTYTQTHRHAHTHIHAHMQMCTHSLIQFFVMFVYG